MGGRDVSSREARMPGNPRRDNQPSNGSLTRNLCLRRSSENQASLLRLPSPTSGFLHELPSMWARVPPVFKTAAICTGVRMTREEVPVLHGTVDPLDTTVYHSLVLRILLFLAFLCYLILFSLPDPSAERQRACVPCVYGAIPSRCPPPYSSPRGHRTPTHFGSDMGPHTKNTELRIPI